MRLRIPVSMILLLGALSLAQSGSECKPVTRYGVSGCELRPDHTCPPGYHQQIVDPPDPRMKAPSFLMCVPDKPQPKDQKPEPPAKEKT
jgi:hypothetical protein